MTFEQLHAATSQFTKMVNEGTGREVIKPMTLEMPHPPPDELHFYRLVVWCYGFFYEAATDVLKEFKALLKQGPPERTNRFDRGSKVVNNLRTYKVHNLPPSKDNDTKRRYAEGWISDASRDGKGITGASQELCRITLEMVSDLINAWNDATKDVGDSNQFIERMLASIDKNWQPHEIDALISEIAVEINLSGIDAKAFRDLHLEEWRKNAGCFIDRGTATLGLRRLISSAMRGKFGMGS